MIPALKLLNDEPAYIIGQKIVRCDSTYPSFLTASDFSIENWFVICIRHEWKTASQVVCFQQVEFPCQPLDWHGQTWIKTSEIFFLRVSGIDKAHPSCCDKFGRKLDIQTAKWLINASLFFNGDEFERGTIGKWKLGILPCRISRLYIGHFVLCKLWGSFSIHWTMSMRVIGKMLVPLGWYPTCLTLQGAL